jgi:hypothetical protein
VTRLGSLLPLIAAEQRLIAAPVDLMIRSLLAQLARRHLHVRPAAMKSATSLLLGAALATAFFLLYTSLCRDLGAASRLLATPPPRWTRGGEEAIVRSADSGQKEAPRSKKEQRKEAVASDGAAGTEEREKQGIVMPAPATKQV